MDFVIFNINHVISEHDRIIQVSGGLHGIREDGMDIIQSIIDFAQNDTYYPTFTKKLSHIMFSITQNHPFNDGNKRTSVALGMYLLQLNELEVVIPIFISEMENIIVWVAMGYINKPLLEKIIYDIIANHELSESTKIYYYNAINHADV